MTTEVVIAPAARRDLRRLDHDVARRVLEAIRQYAETGHGDVRPLTGRTEWRLRVGDVRVLFEVRTEARPAEPPATDAVPVRIIDVLGVRPRGRAYRD